jgi:hypothetical protein
VTDSPDDPRAGAGLDFGHFGEPGDLRGWVHAANTLLDRIASGEYADGMPFAAVIAADLDISTKGSEGAPRACRARCHLCRAGMGPRRPGLLGTRGSGCG